MFGFQLVSQAFQEEMDTYQPKMDALSKAAKEEADLSPNMNKKIVQLREEWLNLKQRCSQRTHQLEQYGRHKGPSVGLSFDFNKWKQHFVTWADQEQLQLEELFRRFDSDHDGKLTRAEFIEGLKATGKFSLQREQKKMEDIAKAFDHTQDGVIDLEEVVSELEHTARKKHGVTTMNTRLVDRREIDREVDVLVYVVVHF